MHEDCSTLLYLFSSKRVQIFVILNFRSIGLLGSSPIDLNLMQNDQPYGDNIMPGVCLALTGLIEQQKNVCTKWPETVESVPFGTRQGLVECEYQFRNDRWNCTDNRDNSRIQQTIERGKSLQQITNTFVNQIVILKNFRIKGDSISLCNYQCWSSSYSG